jgi:hypothetical protein
VKTERLFRERKLGRNEDPEIWINNLEDLGVKLEVMGSNMTNEQFLIQVYNVNLEFSRKSNRHRNGVPSWQSQGNNLHGDTKGYGIK